MGAGCDQGLVSDAEAGVSALERAELLRKFEPNNQQITHLIKSLRGQPKE